MAKQETAMNLEHAEKLATELIAQHLYHLPGAPWKFGWNNRKVAAGVCRYFARQIELSKPLTIYAAEAEVRDTLLHEIAHALTPGHKHDWLWVSTARKIGANGKRCCDEKTAPTTYDAHQFYAKYVAVCPSGLHTFYKHRAPKGRQSCGRCCAGRFDEAHLLTWKLNPNKK